MSDNLKSFWDDYNALQKIVTEYISSFQFGYSKFASKSAERYNQIALKLRQTEEENKANELFLQKRVKEKIDEYSRLRQRIDKSENKIKDKKYYAFKNNEQEINVDQGLMIAHTEQDISRQASLTLKSIEEITNSKLPQWIVRICVLVNKRFREEAYANIVANRKELEKMILMSEKELLERYDSQKTELSQVTVQKVNGLCEEKNQVDNSIKNDKEEFFRKLKELLLDGLENIFAKDTAYGLAYDSLKQYLATYSSTRVESDLSVDTILIGITNQTVSSSDDETLDKYLKTILNREIYDNHTILLPVVLDKYLSKTWVINYYSEYVSGVYTLFENYATQMMNAFCNNGISTYLVDCTNMGSKYSAFTSYEKADDNKRINIIRTIDELNDAIDELSDYIIETNSQYLKSAFFDVGEYNESSVLKREVKTLFISNISEINSRETLSKIVSIVRNGARSGVYSFIGISTDECRVSGIVSQERVNLISEIISMSDKLFMSSDGTISFGNGLPKILPPPAVNPNILQYILLSTVQSVSRSPLIPLVDKLPSKENCFAENCCNEIAIPIGVNEQGQEYIVRLNRDAAYMLIGGNPSCGKSSLIHTIILQCVSRYSPDDLELMIADLKDGSEFDIYARKGIRAVRAVLDDSETDIAVSFLKYIESTYELRIKQFHELENKSGRIIRNIEDYYEVNKRGRFVSHIPRILVIIDEFQSLFNSSRETGEITNKLLRMCRTVGIYIIMASQRVQADASTIRNSFGTQSKEYFIYRAMFKIPYSGAREIMLDQCSDTNRDNPALRRAQTLKTGQILINSNMGSTEKDTQLVQCYYPDNDTIALVCEKIVACQGAICGQILNSEIQAQFNAEFIECQNYVIGESNRLHHDFYLPDKDVFRDDNLIELNSSANRLCVCGSDKRVQISSFWIIMANLVGRYSNKLRIHILASESKSNGLLLNDLDMEMMYVTEESDSYIHSIARNNNDDFVFNVICNPYEYDNFKKDEYSPTSDFVEKIRKSINDENTFTLILCDRYKNLINYCSYIDTDIPYRIISVGSQSDIRSALSLDAAEKIVDTPYNTQNSNVIKAYFYNKQTDKLGRVRMFGIEKTKEYVISKKRADSIHNAESVNYAGLVGN